MQQNISYGPFMLHIRIYLWSMEDELRRKEAALLAGSITAGTSVSLGNQAKVGCSLLISSLGIGLNIYIPGRQMVSQLKELISRMNKLLCQCRTLVTLEKCWRREG